MSVEEEASNVIDISPVNHEDGDIRSVGIPEAVKHEDQEAGSRRCQRNDSEGSSKILEGRHEVELSRK